MLHNHGGSKVETPETFFKATPLFVHFELCGVTLFGASRTCLSAVTGRCGKPTGFCGLYLADVISPSDVGEISLHPLKTFSDWKKVVSITFDGALTLLTEELLHKMILFTLESVDKTS